MEEDDFTVRDNNTILIDEIRRTIANQRGKQDFDEAFHLIDLGYQVRMFDQWNQLLPGVMPFFAVKTNPDPVLLALFAKMNFGFDCASKNEIEKIISLGVSPSRIIYSNTRKQPSFLQYASSMGVDLTTFDDRDELMKIKRFSPRIKLLLRISVHGFTKTSMELMSKKFGCPSKRTADVLKLAKELGLNVIGVSFHVGVRVRVQSSNAWSLAIRESKRVFEEARKLGFTMTLLDIGGSLPPETITDLYTLRFEEPVDRNYDNARLRRSCIWGQSQTCSADLVVEYCNLPEMETGDWLYFPDFGGYSASAASTFNGFQPKPVYRYITESNKKRLDEIISGGGFRHLGIKVELKD